MNNYQLDYPGKLAGTLLVVDVPVSYSSQYYPSKEKYYSSNAGNIRAAFNYFVHASPYE